MTPLSDARAVLVSATQRFGTNKPFLVRTEGWKYRGLRLAETRGWARFVEPDRCLITPAGRAEIAYVLAAGAAK